MIYTETQAVAILTHRIGRLMTQASRSTETYDIPLANAILQLGGTVANPLDVADSDFASIPASYGELMLDLAELYLLEASIYSIMPNEIQFTRLQYLREHTQSELMRLHIKPAAIRAGFLDLHSAQELDE